MLCSLSQIVAVFATVAQVSLAAPEPAITAAAIIPRKVGRLDRRHAEGIRAAIALQNLAARASEPGMGVCYGTGSICDLFLDMSCPLTLEGDDWYKCMCETGYVSTKAACQNCNSFYDLGGVNDGDKWSQSCSSKSFTIAPIPSNVQSAWAKFNATMTYDTARSTGASQTKASSPTKSSGDSTTSGPSKSLQTDGSASGSSSKSSAPFVFGDRTFSDYTTTLGGSPTSLPPTVTAGALPPLANAGSSSQAERQISRTPSVLAVGATVFVLMCGLVFVL